MTLTLDKAYIHARTVSYIHSKGSPSENRSRNESTEDNQLSYYASAEGKPMRSHAQAEIFHRTDQENRKCHKEAVLLSLRKSTSPWSEQSLSPETRHRESVHRESSRHRQGTFVLSPSQFALCWFLLCLSFPFPQNCFLLTFCKYFMSLATPEDFHRTLEACLADASPSAGLYHPLKATASKM